jgi:hypothetical protein
MKVGLSIITIVLLGVLTGCASPEEKAAKAQQQSYEAQGAVAKERLKLVDQYRDCVTASGDDAVRIEACDSYLKAAEALK